MEIQEIVENPDNNFQLLIDSISMTISAARHRIATQINSAMTETYWQIGKYIVEYEQGGKAKVAYGTSTLTELSHQLTLRFGRGFSRPNLVNMRKFYLLYPVYSNCQSLTDNLSWTHICTLMQAEDNNERSFYEKECIAQKWDVRTLRRQMDSALYLRLAVGKDKEEVLALSKEGIQVHKPDDVVRDSYTLEFLGIPDDYHYSETELEQRIIDNLQMFLMEMGKGFTFVKRQYPMTINNRHYHCDLVFYHRILKCFVLVDLKRAGVQHEDIGQMNMYLGYFAKEENMPDDNPPIGIILSHYRDDLLVEYATYGISTNLFVSKYELYLPDKEELRQIVNRSLEREKIEI